MCTSAGRTSGDKRSRCIWPFSSACVAACTPRHAAPADEVQDAAKLTGERFAEVLAYINDHLDQSTAVKDLARISNLSPAQFGRSFQDAIGMSLQRWQMDARVRSAQRLMVDDPTESLTAIASLVGFSDSSHFSRAFLEIVGTTPSAWLLQRT